MQCRIYLYALRLASVAKSLQTKHTNKELLINKNTMAYDHGLISMPMSGQSKKWKIIDPIGKPLFPIK